MTPPQTIKEQFAHFLACVWPETTDPQMIEGLEQTFYAGFMRCFNSVKDTCQLPKDEAMKRMDEYNTELEAYKEHMQQLAEIERVQDRQRDPSA